MRNLTDNSLDTGTKVFRSRIRRTSRPKRNKSSRRVLKKSKREDIYSRSFVGPEEEIRLVAKEPQRYLRT